MQKPSIGGFIFITTTKSEDFAELHVYYRTLRGTGLFLATLCGAEEIESIMNS